MSDDDLFDDNASDYGVGAQLVDGVPDHALDESSDDSDVDDETGAVTSCSLGWLIPTEIHASLWIPLKCS